MTNVDPGSRSGEGAPVPGAPAFPPPSWPAPTGPPGSYPPYRTRTSGLAVASLVLGIVGFFMITALLAVVFGHVALSQVKRSTGALVGRGMAIAGLVLGYVWIAGFVALVVLVATGVIDTATPAECRADRLTLIAAEEAYFAEHGHYTDEEGLVRAGLLTRESDLHSIEVAGGGPSTARDYEVVPEFACR